MRQAIVTLCILSCITTFAQNSRHAIGFCHVERTTFCHIERTTFCHVERSRDIPSPQTHPRPDVTSRRNIRAYRPPHHRHRWQNHCRYFIGNPRHHILISRFQRGQNKGDVFVSDLIRAGLLDCGQAIKCTDFCYYLTYLLTFG